MDHSAPRSLVRDNNEYAAEVTRCSGGGLSVCIRREGFSTQRYASAANLERILLRVGAVANFLLFTSFRSNISLRENQRRFEAIPRLVSSLLQTKRIVAYWLVGHWTDDGDTSRGETAPQTQQIGEAIDRLEYSWLLVQHDKQITSSDWLLTATLLADCYEQHALIVRIDGETTLRSSDGPILETLSSDRGVKDAWAMLARQRSRPDPFRSLSIPNDCGARSPGTWDSAPSTEEAEGIAGVSSYTVLGDGTHHEADFFLAVTGNISSKMHFEAIGATEVLPDDQDSRSPWNFQTPAQRYAAKWIRGKT